MKGDVQAATETLRTAQHWCVILGGDGGTSGGDPNSPAGHRVLSSPGAIVILGTVTTAVGAVASRKKKKPASARSRKRASEGESLRSGLKPKDRAARSAPQVGRAAVRHERVYQTSTIKRDRRTRARIDQLDRQIIDALERDHPQSVRHVFYLMTNPRLPEPVEKSDRGYRHVANRTVLLRRSGALPYGHITDASRRGYFTPTYRNAADFLTSVAGQFRASLWQDVQIYPEVWCESRSIASIVQNDCEELAVSLYPAGGFSSISFAHEAAQFINAEHEGREVVVLYVGDYDPAGVLIDVSLERELREHLDANIELAFERIAITEDQIGAFDLPTKPRKAADRRSLHIRHTVEAEAMPAHILRGLLRDAIEALLPNDALEAARAAEDSERAMLGGLVGMLKRSGGRS